MDDLKVGDVFEMRNGASIEVLSMDNGPFGRRYRLAITSPSGSRTVKIDTDFCFENFVDAMGLSPKTR